MSFGHEQLDVYQATIDYVGWAYHLCERLKGHRSAREHCVVGIDSDSDSDSDPERERDRTKASNGRSEGRAVEASR